MFDLIIYNIFIPPIRLDAELNDCAICRVNRKKERKMLFKKLLTIDEAKEKFADIMDRRGLESEVVKIEQAYGRILAEDVVSNMDVPGFLRTAMDGYAVKCVETAGAGPNSPVRLKMIGEVEMGKAPEFEIKGGECAYVPTGGMVPEGADGLVIIEDTNRGGDIPDFKSCHDDVYIEVFAQAEPEADFVSPDEDVSKDELIIEKGKKLQCREIGVLAALGLDEIRVYKNLKIAIISTGDELVGIGDMLKPPKVRDINSYTLMALAQKYGMEVTMMELLKDDEDIFESKVREAMRDSDIIAASGGSSVGKKDFTARIINKVANPGVIVHGIALKPGKPTILGYDDDSRTVFVGVPGHPSSAMMSFEIIVMDVIRRKYTGKTAEEKEIRAVLTVPVEAKKSRDTCVTVSVKNGEAVPIGRKSGAITMLSRADGYILLKAGSSCKQGDIVNVKIFE